MTELFVRANNEYPGIEYLIADVETEKVLWHRFLFCRDVSVDVASFLAMAHAATLIKSNFAHCKITTMSQQAINWFKKGEVGEIVTDSLIQKKLADAIALINANIQYQLIELNYLPKPKWMK